MDAMEVLEPTARVVAYGGEQIDVRPLTIDQLPGLVRKARPVVDAVFRIDSLPADSYSEMLAVVLDLIEEHGETMIEAVAIACRREPALIAKGALDDFALLALTVFEVNQDFFVRRLVPLLRGRALRSAGDGKTASNSSSNTGTPSPAFAATRSGSSARSARPRNARGGGS